MQSQGIGKQDNWERFMRLSNAARMRNQGLLAGTEVRKNVHLRQSSVHGPKPGRQSTSIPLQQLRDIQYGTGRPAAAYGRILGGKFDSYA